MRLKVVVPRGEAIAPRKIKAIDEVGTDGGVAENRHAPQGRVPTFLALAVSALVASWSLAAAAELGAGESSRAAWFRSLKQPGTNLSCCDISDCRRTKAEWRGNGWVAEVAMPDGTKRWTPIPAERVLKQPHSIDGEAYLCQSAGSVAGPAYLNGIGLVTQGESEPTIYCFIPPDMGS